MTGTNAAVTDPIPLEGEPQVFPTYQVIGYDRASERVRIKFGRTPDCTNEDEIILSYKQLEEISTDLPPRGQTVRAKTDYHYLPHRLAALIPQKARRQSTNEGLLAQIAAANSSQPKAKK